MGSCSYADICKEFMQDILGKNESNCRPELLEYGIDCRCPFNFPIQLYDGRFELLDIPDFSNTIISFLASGDFDVTVNINNSANEHLGCYRLKFTVQKA